jgi:hypothetical protein
MERRAYRNLLRASIKIKIMMYFKATWTLFRAFMIWHLTVFIERFSLSAISLWERSSSRLIRKIFLHCGGRSLITFLISPFISFSIISERGKDNEPYSWFLEKSA